MSNKNFKGKIFHHKNYFNDKKKYSVGSSIIKKKDLNNKNFDNISVISIKDILKRFNYIDIIKLDCEGSEYEIIPYLISHKKKIGKVICELHGKIKDSKNLKLYSKYIKIKKILKTKKLIDNNWFVEHY